MSQRSSLPQRLDRLAAAGDAGALLRGGGKGLEKESLRVNAEGCLAQTPHPPQLGSALTHPSITTDYSEALLEFVTPPRADVRATLAFLEDVHRFVYRHLGEERLWATSMPCVLEGDERIPIARYGRSNVGMMKHVYRRGLGWRYGRPMQTISGVHFNYSFPEALWPALQAAERDPRPLREFRDDWYFRALRNFQRLGWLVPYLFGASPAVCKSFLKGRDLMFTEFDAHTFYEPYGTSLRLSDIGYKNSNQARIGVTYNSLEDYVATLSHAISTPVPDYERIGVKVEGEYRQLNANILQIENEFYGSIRPKQPIERGERATLALKRRGVMYLEVRALDVNAYDPVGVDEPALRFIEALLAHCLLSDSPATTAEEQAAIGANQLKVARQGREPKLELQRDGRPMRLRDWAREVLTELAPLCALLDGDEATCPYTRSLGAQRAAVEDAELTPSARVLKDMRAHGESFFRFAERMSETHRRRFLAEPLPASAEARFVAEAAASLQEQADIEAADRLSFDDYLHQYFSQS
ncbi:MAG TPA: glutamate--cysteine ligase [Gammaproteobacteria bacterium]|nr:glutamate--cysteine ligase [Gammaproteobacteria bacterium]